MNRLEEFPKLLCLAGPLERIIYQLPQEFLSVVGVSIVLGCFVLRVTGVPARQPQEDPLDGLFSFV